MSKLPLFLEVAGRRIVIVGGGSVAARKAAVLRRHGPELFVVSPELHDDLLTLVGEGAATWKKKNFEDSDLQSAFLVFAATNSAEVNRRVEVLARERGILVSRADDSGSGDFQLGATVEKGDIVVSVTTGGRSPALSRVIRDRLEATLTPQLIRIARILGDLREPARRDLPTDDKRKEFYDAILASPIEELLSSGRTAEAEDTLDSICRRFGVDPPIGRSSS